MMYRKKAGMVEIEKKKNFKKSDGSSGSSDSSDEEKTDKESKLLLNSTQG